MKKIVSFLIAVLFVTAILFSVSLSASTFSPLDVGNTNDYGGGDFFGGSDSDWGGGSWGFFGGSDDDGEYSGNSSPVTVVVVVVIVIVIVIIMSKKKQNTAAQTGGLIRRNIPFVADNTGVIEAKIKETDPDFSAEKFIGWTKETFVTLQTAWTERDWSKIRPFEKEELFKVHESQLEEYKRLGRINIISRVDVRSAYMVHYQTDENYEYLTMFLLARMGDYIIDENTKAVIQGDPNAEYELAYQIGFMRKKGVLTNINLSNHSTTNCPNCGAPTTVTSAGQCEYCGSVITSGEFDWVMSKYEGIKPDSNINNSAF